VVNETASRVYAIVLAAGESRRLGRPKQLLELDRSPLVVHVVDRALASSVDAVIVVTGAHASLIELELRERPVYQVFNPDFAEGQGTSIAAGVRALPRDAGAVIVLLGDMPGISPVAISRLADAWRADRPVAAIARYGSGRGHPVLFDRSVFAELGRLSGDEGGRTVLKALGDRVVDVPVEGDVPPKDVNTEDDWRILQQWWKRSSPTGE